MPQLGRSVTVRLAAINAVMAGCLPEYFPLLVSAWDSLREEGYARKGIWQSTTGTASLLLVNGPVRQELGINSRGNLFGQGFRANATIGRAVRLTGDERPWASGRTSWTRPPRGRRPSTPPASGRTRRSRRGRRCTSTAG